MPKASFFQHLGLFGVEHFLDADACRAVREALQTGHRREGTVGTEGSGFVVDPGYRSVKRVDVAEPIIALVRERLMEVKADVESQYGVGLSGCEALQFLAYGVGDHYKPHRDSRADEHGTTTSRARRISAVIFLNGQSADPSTGRYGGGALTFYGLFEQPAGKTVGIPLEADEGLLITFPSETLHAVEPVTHGERYTIATWYY